MENLTIYDALFTLVAGDGREGSLFGECGSLAREAFSHSLTNGDFPTLWFEIPLAGAPRFDLHVAHSRASLSECSTFASGAGNGYDELFSWYANDEAGGAGLAFAYDVSDGEIDTPAVHVNVSNKPLDNMARFFELASAADAAAPYDNFIAALPEGWHEWYAGVHPGRPGSPVRIDCFVDRVLKDEYARNSSLFERDLHTCGFTAFDSTLHELAESILASSLNLELQFDVMHDGSVGQTLGLSARVPAGTAAAIQGLFAEDAPVAMLLDALEQMGLAGMRWRHIPETVFAVLLSLDDGPLALYCRPAFIKLRMRNGKPLDAKIYLQAGAATHGFETLRTHAHTHTHTHTHTHEH